MKERTFRVGKLTAESTRCIQSAKIQICIIYMKWIKIVKIAYLNTLMNSRELQEETGPVGPAAEVSVQEHCTENLVTLIFLARMITLL